MYHIHMCWILDEKYQEYNKDIIDITNLTNFSKQIECSSC